MLIPLPDWAQAARLLLTFLVTAAAGVHAYIVYRQPSASPARDISETPLRWGFFLYAGVFLFASVLNFIYVLITVAMRSYAPGPFKLGTLSLILFLSYIVVVFGSGRRARLT